MKHAAMVRSARETTAIVAVLLAGLPAAFAHHSTAEYDAAQLVEARGQVVTVLWRNPHVR